MTVTEEVVTEDKSNSWNNEWDELLITAVSQRSPLYNYRLPLKERTSLKLADLWKEICISLGISFILKK